MCTSFLKWKNNRNKERKEKQRKIKWNNREEKSIK